ncbi:hypothetical protein [Arsenicicoccus dermatophilus]|uniref:hypothetical protein n=1 Tax=Arsenicicoccus dermatophilus TaxID=1076331 RepID=UPI003916EBD0
MADPADAPVPPWPEPRRRSPREPWPRRASATTALLTVLLLVGCSEPAPRHEPTAPGRRLLAAGQQSGFRVAGLDPDSPDALADFRRDVDRLVALHQQWIRYDVPSWVIAPRGTATTIEWDDAAVEEQREAIRYAKSRGLKVMIVTSGAPDWSARFTTEEYVAASRRYWAGLREAVGPWVDVWQVFNEADTTHHRTFTKVSPTPAYLEQLRTLLGVARDVLAGGDGGRPITTNVTGWPCDAAAARRWQSYFSVLGEYLDVVSVDAYPGTDSALVGALPGHLAELARETGRPVYLTEFGLQTAPGTFSAAQQERAYLELLAAVAHAEVPVVLAYELRDTERPHAPAGFGILTAQGQPKPGYPAVAAAMGG